MKAVGDIICKFVCYDGTSCSDHVSQAIHISPGTNTGDVYITDQLFFQWTGGAPSSSAYLTKMIVLDYNSYTNGAVGDPNSCFYLLQDDLVTISSMYSTCYANPNWDNICNCDPITPGNGQYAVNVHVIGDAVGSTATYLNMGVDLAFQ